MQGRAKPTRKGVRPRQRVHRTELQILQRRHAKALRRITSDTCTPERRSFELAVVERMNKRVGELL